MADKDNSEQESKMLSTYAGPIDRDNWGLLTRGFKLAAERHREDEIRHAEITTDRMIATVGAIAPNLMMAILELLALEYEETEGEPWTPDRRSPFQETFDAMCDQFAAGYQPKGATEFVQDFVARMNGLR
jgi:hypothetical protein